MRSMTTRAFAAEERLVHAEQTFFNTCLPVARETERVLSFYEQGRIGRLMRSMAFGTLPLLNRGMGVLSLLISVSVMA